VADPLRSVGLLHHGMAQPYIQTAARQLIMLQRNLQIAPLGVGGVVPKPALAVTSQEIKGVTRLQVALALAIVTEHFASSLPRARKDKRWLALRPIWRCLFRPLCL